MRNGECCLLIRSFVFVVCRTGLLPKGLEVRLLRNCVFRGGVPLAEELLGEQWNEAFLHEAANGLAAGLPKGPTRRQESSFVVWTTGLWSRCQVPVQIDL